jgi:hypothetical protein
MANPTTNYGFVLPTSSDLVTDLPADFDVALQGVDTRLKALQPGTTLGDIAYSSATANTNTRLAVGSTGQVLTVAGGVPTWATASSGGMTLLASGSLSGSSVDLTSISGSYVNLQLFIDNVIMSATNESVKVEVNAGGNNHFYSTSLNNTTLAGSANNSNMFLTSGNLTNAQSAVFNIYDYTSANAKLIFSEGYTISANNRSIQFGSISGTGAITSIKLIPSGGTFTGNYKLYGVK